MNGESETTGEVDPTRGRHAGREAERGRKERAGTARKMQVRKVWRAVRRAPSAAGAVASARAHVRPSSFISHPPQVTQTSNKSRADATLRKRSLRSTGGASGLDEGMGGAGVMSRGMRARPARTTGARGADGPATDSRREREGGQRAGECRPCLARYETGRRRGRAWPPSSGVSRCPRAVKERSWTWTRTPRALRCAAPQVRREVGASLTAPITPALKRTKTEASTGGMGVSTPPPGT